MLVFRPAFLSKTGSNLAQTENGYRGAFQGRKKAIIMTTVRLIARKRENRKSSQN